MTGMIVLKSYIREKEKRNKGETQGLSLQGGFWISTLPGLMLGKRVTKEIGGAGGWGQRSEVSEQ